MPKKAKIKERAKIHREAQQIGKAAAEKAKAEKPAAQRIEDAPASEHRQLLTKFSPLQDAPGRTPTGKPANRMGTKGLYSDAVCVIVEELAAKGCTDVEIAKSLGIGIRTLYDWKERYPHFSQALDKYRGVVNMYVENAFIRSALGYDYTEEQLAKDGFPVEVRRHVTGSVAAQKFYLMNRLPDRYKNKIETVHSLGGDIAQMVVAIKRRED